MWNLMDEFANPADSKHPLPILLQVLSVQVNVVSNGFVKHVHILMDDRYVRAKLVDIHLPKLQIIQFDLAGVPSKACAQKPDQGGFSASACPG